MQQKIVKQIEDLGLTEKKAKVYVALLEHGLATADEIAKATKLNRSTTYVQMESLMLDGLATKSKDGKKTKFSPESPNKIDRLLHEQRNKLKERESKAQFLIPELINLYSLSGERPIVRYFEGINGLRSLREELLKVKSKEYFAAASIDNMRKLFTAEELSDFSAQRAKKKIQVHLMYTLDESEEGFAVGNQKLLRIDQKAFPFTSDVYIYDDCVSFAVTEGKVGGIIIKSKAVAQTMKSIYKLSWEGLSSWK